MHLSMMRLNKANCKVLHLNWNYPRHMYRLAEEIFESKPTEKYLGVLVDKRLDMNQQYVFTYLKTENILGCIRRGLGSRVMEVILPCHY